MHQENIFIKNRNGYKISIRLTVPEKATKLAFLEHGFSGCKDERHMVVLEEKFSKQDYIVVNFDAVDSLNDSESSSEGITFTSHYNDLIDVIEWAKHQPWFTSPFTLAGHSMGAASVLLYAQNYPENVDLLLPISFPWLSGKSKLIQDNPKELKKWKTLGYWDKTSKSRGRTLRVPYSFIEDLMLYDFSKQIEKITAKTILIIGDLENDIRLQDNKNLLDRLTCKKELIILHDVPHVVAKKLEDEKNFVKL
ncbi:MAG: alpha/beta hydrolase [Alphaproteobacteria bacterium]|nr:alpha/beta hydrolase [Alphaproteobacteria bacterium]